MSIPHRGIRTVFFGDVSSPFGIPLFFELIKTPGCEIVGVVLSPPGQGDWIGPMPVPDRYGQRIDRDLLAYVSELGVPLLRPQNLRNPGFCASLAQLDPALIVSAGFRKIIPSEVLLIPHIAAVNFHPAKLPRMRGNHPCFWTILYGEREGAATVHYMAEGVDAGDIILLVPIRIADDETCSTLMHKAIVESLRLVEPLISGLQTGSLSRTPQNEAQALKFNNPKPEDYRIDWRKPSRQIDNLIRASLSTPGALTTYIGKQIRLLRTEIGTDSSLITGTESAGTILKMSPHAAVVKTGDGALILRQVLFEGKTWPAPDFISAARCPNCPDVFL
jgi:methionyl-tRNA formyltransferase